MTSGSYWRGVSGAALALMLLIGAGMSSGSSVQAQDRGNRDQNYRSDEHHRGDRSQSRDNRSYSDRNQRNYRIQGRENAPRYDQRNDQWRNREGWDRRGQDNRERDRYWDRDHNRWVYPGSPYYRGYSYSYGYPYYPNYGYAAPYYGGSYGYYGGGYDYGYGRGDEARGYHDGLDRGREDARSHRYPDPNNSEHFRHGNPSYRAGFARGYQVGFREYGGGYRRW